MSHKDLELRRSIIAHCLAMNASGLNQGTSGNISIRHGDGMLITPTSMPYEQMQPDDIVFVGADGSVHGSRNPSSEWRFHRDILAARPDANAVVHTHSTYATILAILGREIPAIHYMIAVAGGSNVRVAPYALYGSQALSDHVVAALHDRTACLMEHHGMIALGDTVEKAMWVAAEVETLARQYHGCLQLDPNPPLLTDDQIAEVLAKISATGYGKASGHASG